MEITVHNLGAVRQAQISIKPLTVFVGPNNTGKTWLAYTIAGIFSLDRLTDYISNFDEKIGNYPSLDQAIDLGLKDGNAIIDMVQFAEKYGEAYLNDITHSAHEWLPEFMNTHLASFEETDISISLTDTKSTFLKKILDSTFQFQLSYKEETRLGLRKKQGESQLYIYTVEVTNLEETITQKSAELPVSFIKTIVGTLLFQIIRNAFYPQVRILPTERTTALTFPIPEKREQIENLSISPQTSQAWRTKTVIEPVNTFLSMLTSAYSTNVKTRRGGQRRKSDVETYSQLAKILEEHILDGKVEFTPLEASLLEGSNQLELGLSTGLTFKTTAGPKLEISIASSMVKELAPLVLYLRDIANQGDLLIIDEPEKSLHPEAQAKMIEFLAMLVNAGLNVIVTTHSPYVVDHLANLIKANDVQDKELISQEFYLKDTNAFISKTNISVYIFEHGGAKKAIDEDGIIQWNTFSEVSDRLAEIYFKL